MLTYIKNQHLGPAIASCIQIIGIIIINIRSKRKPKPPDGGLSLRAQKVYSQIDIHLFHIEGGTVAHAYLRLFCLREP